MIRSHFPRGFFIGCASDASERVGMPTRGCGRAFAATAERGSRNGGKVLESENAFSDPGFATRGFRMPRIVR